MRLYKKYYWSLLSLLLCYACTNSQESSTYAFPYDLENPDREYKLKSELAEISGMAYLDDDRMALVQDEKGELFIFDLRAGKVEAEIDIGGRDDYEGVAFDGKKVYVLASHGKIRSGVLDEEEEKFRDKTSVALPLGKKEEIEGICHQPGKSKLLLAYKTSRGFSGRDACGIYTYKSGKTKHSRRPVFMVSNQKVAEYVKRLEPEDEALSKLVKKERFGSAIFQPSAAAIHPGDGHLYLLSAVNELLMVVDLKKGQIVFLHQFNKDDVSQGEGIAFDGRENLYIATEKGEGKRAKIFRFVK